MKTITDDLEQILQEYQGNLYKRAETYRQEVIIPFCVEYDLEFVSGMGSYCFWYGENPLHEEDVDGSRYADTKLLKSKRFCRAAMDIFKVLDHELTLYDKFGYYISDYKRES